MRHRNVVNTGSLSFLKGKNDGVVCHASWGYVMAIEVNARRFRRDTAVYVIGLVSHFSRTAYCRCTAHHWNEVPTYLAHISYAYNLKKEISSMAQADPVTIFTIRSLFSLYIAQCFSPRPACWLLNVGQSFLQTTEITHLSADVFGIDRYLVSPLLVPMNTTSIPLLLSVFQTQFYEQNIMSTSGKTVQYGQLTKTLVNCNSFHKLLR